MNLYIGKIRHTGLILALILTLNIILAPRSGAECTDPLTPEARNRQILNITLAGAGVITVWGVANWDYFSRTPHAESEDWFGQSTKEGGLDKLGHVFATYATAQGLSALLERRCFTPEDAAWYGALSSLAIMGFMEAGDSFSSYGFSYEDFMANTLGGIASYYRYRYPSLASKVDLRWEIGIHPNQADVLTDYENSKYLLALKLNGFERFSTSILKHVELQAGYYTRGYSDDREPDERNLYVGIGLNLTDLFRRGGYRKMATFFNFYQPPYTYLAVEKQLPD